MVIPPCIDNRKKLISECTHTMSVLAYLPNHTSNILEIDREVE